MALPAYSVEKLVTCGTHLEMRCQLPLSREMWGTGVRRDRCSSSDGQRKSVEDFFNRIGHKESKRRSQKVPFLSLLYP